MNGKDAKLYLAPTPVTAPVSGDFTGAVVVKGVVDVTMSGSSSSTFDKTTRDDVIGTDGKGKPKFSINVTLMNKKEAESFVNKAWDSFINDTELAIGVMDRDITNAQSRGLISNMLVHDMVNPQLLNDRQTLDVTLRPSSFPAFKNPAPAA